MKPREFMELLRTQRNRIYSYAYYLVRHREDAEDVTQEAFVRLWQRCPARDGKGRLAWLIRVTYNLCMDVKRHRQRAAAYFSEAAKLRQPEGNTSADPDPEQRLQLDQTQRKLLTALAQLPDATQNFLLLHYFQGLTYREIGEITDTHPTTVKVQVHRGRQTLKRLLAAEADAQIGQG